MATATRRSSVPYAPLRTSRRRISRPLVARRSATSGNTVGAVQLGLASSEFTQGEIGLAFGVIATDNRFIYGKSAVYIALSPDDVPERPLSGTGDLLAISAAISQPQRSSEGDSIAAIYAAEAQLATPGRYAVLARDQIHSSGSGGWLRVYPGQAVEPDPERWGSARPAISTVTVATAGGDIGVDRDPRPAEDLHDDPSQPARHQTRCPPFANARAGVRRASAVRSLTLRRSSRRNTGIAPPSSTRRSTRQYKVREGLREPLRRLACG